MNKIIKTDLVVLGAGPGGYTAAFLASDLGLHVTLVDPEANPGGVCLHRGCIPTKALLHISKIKQDALKLNDMGMQFQEPYIDIDKIRAWKESVVSRLTSGLTQLAKARQIEHVQGYGHFTSSTCMNVNCIDGSSVSIEYTNAIVATGSKPRRLPFLDYNSDKILDATKALALQFIPKRLLLIGGGYIGLEMACIYQSLGALTTIVETNSSIMTGMDPELTRIFEAHNKNFFKEIKKSTKVLTVEEHDKHVSVTFENNDGEQITEEYEAVLVAIGQTAYSDKCGLEHTNVQCDDKGFITVDNQQRTADAAIFAIGDVVGGPLLAHKASYEARIAVEAILGKKTVNDAKVIPAVVYTEPEIATVGLSEQAAKDMGIAYKVAKFPWAASGRAVAMGETMGLTKLIIDQETERLLGAGIVGKNAGDLIPEMALAIEMGATASDIELTIHPHPTLSETIMETAGTFYGQATHVFQNIRK